VVVHRSLRLQVMVMMMIRKIGVLMWVIRKRRDALSGRKIGHVHLGILPKSQLDKHVLPVMGIQFRRMVRHGHIVVGIVYHLSRASSDNAGPCL